MPGLESNPPKLKAPTGDGGLLLWPSAGEILGDAAANGRRLDSLSTCRIQNVPLNELRRHERQWIGHADVPIFATGHQTELYHPGVWAKDAVIGAAAARAGGVAIHFAVDTDAPKHLDIRWPGGSSSIVDDPALSSAEWCGQLAAPTPDHLDRLAASLHAAQSHWNFQPMAFEFIAILKRLSLESLPLSNALTQATHELDWSLGLRHHAMLTGPIWGSAGYLVLAHHVLARAGDWAADYNAALAHYRADHHMHSRMRPMPDLAASAQSCEVPFWLDDLTTGRRQRASVDRGRGNWVLKAGTDSLELPPADDGWESGERLGKFLREHALRLSPRALTLTTFLRLLVVDQFVHGIGGAEYDQVADHLIARHFSISPPKFAVATATQYFPTAIGRTRVCLPCMVAELHRLRHRALGPAKETRVAEIAALPRHSPRRGALFMSMHRDLNDAIASSPAVADFQQKLAEARVLHGEEQTLFDRELFYALQPRERLLELIGRCEQAIAAG